MKGIEAEKVIEWITHVMGVPLTEAQQNLIHLWLGSSDPGSIHGHKFAELLVAEYCEEMDHSAMGAMEARNRERLLAQSLGRKAHPRGGKPVYDEAARIPDRVFMDAHAVSASDEGFAQDVYDEVLTKRADDWAKQLAAQVVETQNTLELLHGHGPAEVTWETDFDTYTSRAKVTMPIDPDCAVCVKVQQDSKLQEDSDG